MIMYDCIVTNVVTVQISNYFPIAYCNATAYSYVYIKSSIYMTHHIFLTNCEHGSGRHVSSVTAKTDFSAEMDSWAAVKILR